MKKNLKTIFSNGIYAGMFFYSILFVLSLFWNAGFSVMGVKQSEVTKFVFTRFWPEVLLIQVKILTAYLVVGALIGFLVKFVNNNTFKFKKIHIIFVPLTAFYLLILNVKTYPQLYTESFYDRGGLLKLFETFITDSLPYGVFIGINYVFFVLITIAFILRVKNNIKQSFYIISIVLAVFLSINIGKGNFIPGKNNGPNILILACDSLRYDRVYTRKDLAPNINALIDNGVIFKSHFSSLPRTFPAMASLLTARYPVHHGIRHMFPDKWNRDLSEYSFVEMLKKQGYKTAAAGDFAGDVFSRMQAGFDTMKAPYFNFVTLINQRSLEMHFLLMPYLTNNIARKAFPELKEFANNGDPLILENELEDVLNGLKNKDKFFCLTFFSATHFPYAAPYPFYGKYTLKSYSGRYKYHKPPTIYEKEKMTDNDIKQINGLYDGCVSAFDTSVGKVIGYLKKNGLYDNTIIIITADHGENLYENGWSTGHGEHLRGPYVVNIPLVIKFPYNEYKNASVDCVTREVDVMPTLFDYIGKTKDIKVNVDTGVDPELTKIDGESIMPILKKEKKDMNITAFTETGIWFSGVTDGFYQKERIMYPDITGLSEVDFTYKREAVIKKEYKDLMVIAKHRMIDDGKYRLIYIPERDGVKYELYDLSAKDGYINDVSTKYPEKLKEMKAKLFKILDTNESVYIRE